MMPRPASEAGTDCLRWRNIHCIPSYHGSISFAVEVQKALDRVRYGCICVELPQGWEEPTVEAVRLLPRISGVVAEDRGYVVMPGDSLIEGVRQGLRRDIPVEFVDVLVQCDYENESVLGLPDFYYIQVKGLADYFQLARPLLRHAGLPEGHHLRNRHMAHRLNQLAQQHEQILFICGAAHWDEIVELLESGDHEDCSSYSLGRNARLLRFEDNSELNMAPWNGEFPFDRWQFYLGASTAEALLARLLDAAVRNYRYDLGIRQIQHVQQYAARLARLRPAITPGLHDILTAARDVVGDSFATEVMYAALSYPSQADPAQLEPCFTTGWSAIEPLFWQDGAAGERIEVLLPQGEGEFEKTIREFGDRPRRNPKVEDAAAAVFSDRTWGRYADEMERESAFLGAIVRNYLQSVRPDQGESVLFEGDLKGGLDMREILRGRIIDGTSRDLFVKDEDQAVENDIGAVILFFDADEIAHDCQCYTYGRHLALGYTSSPDRSGATAKIRWGLLASFLHTYGQEEKMEVVEKIHGREIEYYSYDECLAEALKYALKPRILYVAPHAPSSWLHQEAQHAGKVLSYIPISSLAESLVESIRTYNVYFYPE